MNERRPSLIDYAEAAGALVVFGFFRILPLDWASGIGGFLARRAGPHLGITKRARDNLRLAMPELSPDATEEIIRGMWDNLGRVVAEYAHLRRLGLDDKQGRIELIDRGNILGERPKDKRYIFFSAHCANWEIAVRTASQVGFAMTAVYRAPNNPIVDRLLAWARGSEDRELAPKGSAGARKVVAALRGGREVCMLIDQKMNDGIPVPFFGRIAMTAPALALLALRLDCAVVPVHVVRLNGARFRMTLEPPLELPHSGDADADQLTLMTTVNAIVEGWIREHPEQWLWLHRRWPD